MGIMMVVAGTMIIIKCIISSSFVQVMGSMGYERVRMAGVHLARSLDLGILAAISASR
jgi:hypothetical protein